VYTDIFLVVQPVVQPVVQRVASCIRGFRLVWRGEFSAHLWTGGGWMQIWLYRKRVPDDVGYMYMYLLLGHLSYV